MIRLWFSSIVVILIITDTPGGYGAGVPLVKFGNKDYYFSYNFKANFFQAQQVCEAINMRLVTIPTKEVNDFLFNTVGSANQDTNFWTSGSNILDGKTYVWISTGQPVVFTNWQKGQPSIASQRCILAQLVKGNGLFWSNIECFKLNYFICESVEPNVQNQVAAGNWANLFAEPSVSPNFPIFIYNKKSYFVATQVSMEFLSADRFCKMINMELVSVDSEAENNYLYQYLRNINIHTRYWSGGTRLINAIDWIWLPSGRKVTYTHWQKGRPDNMNEFCIEFVLDKDNGLFWNDLSCGTALPFICEAPVEKITRCPVVDPACYGKPGVNDVVPQTRKAPVITYHKLNTPVTFSDAVKACSDQSMSLVSIQSQEKSDAVNQFVKDNAALRAFWTSGARDKVKKSFFWITGEPIVFTNWNTGEPNDSGMNEECIEIAITSNGPKWNDVPCNMKVTPICEKVVQEPTPPPSEGHCCGYQTPVVNIFFDKGGVEY